MNFESLTWIKQDETGDPLGQITYRTQGARGAEYGLIRNAHHPDQLFAVSLKSMRVYPGWYTDRDGTIKKLGR